MKNIFVQTDCQRSIAKSGYTYFSDWVASAVNQDCKHVNTDLSMENNFLRESQHRIAKSGYTSFSDLVASAVNQECQHINTSTRQH